MPFRQRGFYGGRRNRRLGSIIDSNKNIVSGFDASTAGTTSSRKIAEAQDSATLAVTKDVERGCSIKAIWVEFWISSTQEIAVGVTTGIDVYLWKNPGSNLTAPTPGTQGSSNEKKHILKIWKGLIGARTQGFQPYSWKGWIKIPKGFQRMGANDLIQLVWESTGANVLVCQNYVYKWYK